MKKLTTTHIFDAVALLKIIKKSLPNKEEKKEVKKSYVIEEQKVEIVLRKSLLNPTRFVIKPERVEGFYLDVRKL